ncbi:hypothetical protein NMG60_11035093 [Bertholletia excelsa]
MGNCSSSCCTVEPPTAILIDAQGKRRKIKAPVTAAEIMLDQPGHVVSPAFQIRRTGRIPAMKADEQLSVGHVYLVVPASRINSKASESEMEFIESSCGKRRSRRRSSKVLPMATGISDDKIERPVTISQGNGSGLTGQRLGSLRQWKPVLEPISE